IKNAIVNVYCAGVYNEKRITNAGSGWLYTFRKRLYVLSGAHIVLMTDLQHPFQTITVEIAGINGNPKEIRNFYASIVGIDVTADVVVLRLSGLNCSNKSSNFVTLSFADSDLEKEGNPCFI